MPSRRGRRDNGLEAQFYVPLRDVDPRVGEHLLDLLREAGIAAYLEPSSDTDQYTRAVSLPSPPSDRLWVDRTSRPEASTLVTAHADDDTSSIPRTAVPRGPSRPARDDPQALDEDAIWQQIVAGYGREEQTPVPRWPVQEDLGTRPEPTPDRIADPPEPRIVHAPAPEPDEHFVPPPPPPVPRLQRATVGALFVIALGVTSLFAPGLLGLPLDVSFVLGVLGIVGGMGFLFYRLREKLPVDDDPDDGAVV